VSAPKPITGRDLGDENDARCTVPPAGWECTRRKGHDGPCAARPVGVRVVLPPNGRQGRVYVGDHEIPDVIAVTVDAGVDRATTIVLTVRGEVEAEAVAHMVGIRVKS
jgi:hypothetical protein